MFRWLHVPTGALWRWPLKNRRGEKSPRNSHSETRVQLSRYRLTGSSRHAASKWLRHMSVHAPGRPSIERGARWWDASGCHTEKHAGELHRRRRRVVQPVISANIDLRTTAVIAMTDHEQERRLSQRSTMELRRLATGITGDRIDEISGFPSFRHEKAPQRLRDRFGRSTYAQRRVDQ